MPKISVIVPAYNAEKYLCETLDCLSAQTLKDIEVIIVNDGSTDNTQVLINEYCEKTSDDIMFKSIVQKNSGVSAARNRGLEASTGEYVLFLDSDDLLTDGSLETFYRELKEYDADIAIGRLQSFGAVKERYNPFADKLANKKEIETFDKQLLWNFLVGNKCYKRERLLASGVRFPLLKYSEEGAFFMEFVYMGAKIVGTADACMKYRRHSAEEGLSVSQSVSLSLVSDFISSLTRIYNAAEKALNNAPPQVDREDYLQEILYKTDYILISQFYRLIWRADDDCLRFIEESHKALCSKMINKTIEKVNADNTDLPVYIFDKRELSDSPQISVILGSCGNSDVTETIQSLFAESMPAFELFVPSSLLEQGRIPEKWRKCENIKPLPDRNFWRNARKTAKSSRILRIKKPFKLDDRLFRFILKSDFPNILKNRFFNELFYAITAAFKFKGL